ncbi:hypothetical protein FB382_001329 [Nocardioides ginsengisegetis]|uniref:Concanavalin A-like lectin/glucanases superfamily protein n=1 Tax=Nocardioides ginsengisegetis TaxID=661491 RepID=A0A7W3P907_9ACTN|nr:hypothetical protein [Nocardioides ginsengisegetis]MBA8803038.1 hypothetical protein [Nocardioides ginsengisegetis]
MSRARLLSPSRALVAAVAVALLAAWLATGTTRSGWTVSTLANDPNTTRAASLAFTHTYGSTSCSAGPRVAGTQACSGSIVGSDTISNSGDLGTGRLSAAVKAASCAPVQLGNAKSGTNPLLPRYAAAFRAGGPMTGSSAISLDGSSAYAASVVQQTTPSGFSLGAAYGWGVWFKTTSTAGGAMFGFTDKPDNTSTANADHLLYMDGAGHIGFGYSATASTGTSPGSYNNGSWHFAYVRVEVTQVVVTLTTWTLYVDGASVASVGGAGLGGGSSTGYWHLGWSPLSARTYGTGLSNYFTGSLSNFVVFHASPAPDAVPNPSSQTAFDTFASSATEQWRLDDTGTTTFGGNVPGTTASPCTMFDVTWSFTSPASTPVSGLALATFADNSFRPVAAPGAGGSQSSALTVSRGSTYDPDVAGLRLYVPISWTVESVPTGSSWSLAFAWTSADAVVVA